MDVLLSIGDFSRMTYLSVKALRHYHDVDLLEPATVDPATGYRFYRPDQVATAQVIRRFRDLGMPLDEVRSVLQAPDVDARNRAIVAHLERMERQLAQTQETVASLRGLLSGTRTPAEVRYRSEPVTPSFAIVERVRSADAVAWWMAAFGELHKALRDSGATRSGPDGALFPDDFFEIEEGELVAFVPAAGAPPAGARIVAYDVPAAELAVTSHHGPFSDLDQTYGALGTWVAERAVGAAGPIRERYLPLGDEDDLLNHETEVCWPVSHNAA
ncbi:MAG TPA: MerR family transcriptional regulator [Mycobacteriales bacterium]|jgi:DNA-binding transcriptional MerR regulator